MIFVYKCLVTCDLLGVTEHHCCKGDWQQDSASCCICLFYRLWFKSHVSAVCRIVLFILHRTKVKNRNTAGLISSYLKVMILTATKFNEIFFNVVRSGKYCKEKSCEFQKTKYQITYLISPQYYLEKRNNQD